MAPRSAPILFALFSIVAVVVLPGLAAAARGGALGAWKPVADVYDPEVKKIATFAIEEHNKKAGVFLALDSLIKAETQTVAGTNYRIVLTAKAPATHGAPKTYTVVVNSKPWENYLSLTSFEETKG